MMYFLSQGGDVIAVRTGGDPAAVMPTVRASIQADDQSLRISAIETIPCLREQALTQEKLIAKLASFFRCASSPPRGYRCIRSDVVRRLV
jgi:hypothetical protein